MNIKQKILVATIIIPVLFYTGYSVWYTWFNFSGEKTEYIINEKFEFSSVEKHGKYDTKTVPSFYFKMTNAVTKERELKLVDYNTYFSYTTGGNIVFPVIKRDVCTVFMLVTGSFTLVILGMAIFVLPVMGIIELYKRLC